MARDEQIMQNFETEIDVFSKFKLDDLIYNTESWGSLNFEDAQPDLQKIFDIISYLTVLPVNELTDAALNKIVGSLSKTNKILGKINGFSVEIENPKAIRHQIVEEIKAQADDIYNVATPWIPFLAYQKGDVQKNIVDLQKAIDKASEILKEGVGELETKKNEMDDILSTAREAAARAGAAVFTDAYDGENTVLKNQAVKWITATVVMSIITIATVACFWFWADNYDSTTVPWMKITTKFMLLALLISGTFWCGRIYKATLHQAAQYRHRALSIQTIQAFVAAAKDPAVKDGVVLEAARAIYGNTGTGLIDGTSAGGGDARIIEVVKNLIPGPE